MRPRMILLTGFLLALGPASLTSAGAGPAPDGPPVSVDDAAAVSRFDPAMAHDPSEDLIAVWRQPGAEGSTVMARLFDGRGPVGPTFQVGFGDQATVASDEEGYVVVWFDSGEIRGRRFDRTGEQTGGQLVIAAGNPRRRLSDPKVARLGAGTDVVMWYERTGASSGLGVAVRMQLVDPRGEPALEEPITLASGLLVAGGHRPLQPNIAVASARTGSLVAVFPEEEKLLAARFDAGGRELGERLELTAGWPADPEIAVDGTGNYVIVWSEPGPSREGSDIRGLRLDAGGAPLGPPFRANPTAANDQRRPAVAANASGHFVVVWERAEQFGGAAAVVGRRFDPRGRPVGGEFLVNVSVGAQPRPAVASDAVGRLAVAWQEETEGGSDVLLQRYAAWMCVPETDVLCLGERRFALEVAWRDFAGRTGRGRARAVNRDTGAFWFFHDANLELAVKVLDGTALNGYYWLFHGGLSTVEQTLTATDTYTGATKIYRNSAGRLASGGDVAAFREVAPALAALATEAPRTTAASPEQGADLRLRDGRFEVEVRWRDFAGRRGPGRGVALTRDTGCFWFFDETNVELLVKVLDGTAWNGHYWVFYGSLTNVAYDLAVTDLETEARRRYRNPLGRFRSAADLAAFPR